MLVKTPQVAEKDMWHQFLLTSCVVILKSFAILAIQSARAFEKSLRGCGHAAGQKRCKKMAISLAASGLGACRDLGFQPFPHLRVSTWQNDL